MGLLEQLRAMIGAARDAYSGQAKLDAEKRFEELTGEIQDAQAPAADDAMSAAERAALAGLDKNVVLAALTSGLEDDKSAAAAKEQFLSGLLNQALSVGRSDSVITELADAVASARSNLQSLTGNGSNDNADFRPRLTSSVQGLIVRLRTTGSTLRRCRLSRGPAILVLAGT